MPAALAYRPHQQSTWHSPVPYLFGGLAAMLGLIAFALFILACSYWKLSGFLDNSEEDNERDLEAGEANGGAKVKLPVMEEKYFVIMAGQAKPTYLATPMSSRASSFGSNCTCSSTSSTLSLEDNFDVKKRENDEAHETSADQVY